MFLANFAFYRSPTNSRYLAIENNDFINGQIFYSPDGKTFYQFARRGFERTSHTCTITIEDPRNQVTGEIKAFQGILTLGNDTYKDTYYKSIRPPLKTVAYLPITRQPLFLFNLPDEYLLISNDRYSDPYASLRIYKGPAHQMEELKIFLVNVDIDGEICEIATSAGTYINYGHFSTWDEETLLPEHLPDYRIKEGASFTKIS